MDLRAFSIRYALDPAQYHGMYWFPFPDVHVQPFARKDLRRIEPFPYKKRYLRKVFPNAKDPIAEYRPSQFPRDARLVHFRKGSIMK